jgi:hypothetical protein
LYRRAGDLVDKILRGAKSGDIPVLQPTKFRHQSDHRKDTHDEYFGWSPVALGCARYLSNAWSEGFEKLLMFRPF